MVDYKVSDFIDDFLISKEVEEGCASSTIKAYRYDLKKFINLVGDLNLESPMLRQRIRLFLKQLKDLNYTKKGISRKIDANDPTREPIVFTAYIRPIRPESPCTSRAYKPIPTGSDIPMSSTGIKPRRKNNPVVVRERDVKVAYIFGYS